MLKLPDELEEKLVVKIKEEVKLNIGGRKWSFLFKRLF